MASSRLASRCLRAAPSIFSSSGDKVGVAGAGGRLRM